MSKIKRRLFPLFSALVFLLFLAETHAGIITPFSDKSAFSAVTSNSINIDFAEGLAGNISVCGPQWPWVPDPCTYSSSGVNITSTIGNPILGVRPGLEVSWLYTSNGANKLGAITSHEVPANNGDLVIDFDFQSAQSFGIDIIGRGYINGVQNAVAVTATDIDGNTVAVNTNPTITGTGAFAGFASSIGLKSIDIHDSTPMGDVSFSLTNITVNPVSEPNSFQLITSALAILLFVLATRVKPSECQ